MPADGRGGHVAAIVAYFAGARSGGPWTVLGIWAGAGLLLTLTAHRSIRSRSSLDPSFSAVLSS
jgi:hypothetical protein